MVHDFHIRLEVMMENAGRALAELAHHRFQPRSAVVLTGPGGNGGGGLVAARHLSNRGLTVHIVLSRPAPDLAPVTALQLDMVQRIGLAIVDEPPPADLVIDALIGYSLRGDPMGRSGELIGWANSQPVPVLALDVPSGLDATSGRAGVPCVRAAATLTLALPKTGLARALDLVGDLYLADISVPPVLYERMGIEVGPLFADGPLVELRVS